MKGFIYLVSSMALAAACVAAEVHRGTIRGEKKGWWTASAQYPLFDVYSPVLNFARRSLKIEAQKEVHDFLKEAPTLVYNGKPNPPFVFESSYAISLVTKNLVSLNFSEYEDAGGAHPNTLLVCFNFGLVNGKPKKLVLKDLFKTGVDADEVVNDILMARLKTKHLSFVDDGQITSLTPDQLNDFVITRKGLSYLFSAYVVASYAEGPQFVDVKFSELKGLDPEGPLKGMLRL